MPTTRSSQRRKPSTVATKNSSIADPVQKDPKTVPKKSETISSDLPVIAFTSKGEFETYLEENHLSSPGFSLKFAKKSSGIVSISVADAVEVALCFGWINGRADSINEQFYLGRFTPRRPKSMWSQINVNTAERLIKEGRMRPAGLAAIEAAKADGRWERAYAAPKDVTVPLDLEQMLELNPAAKAFFGGLNKSQRYSVLWRIETASPTARESRMSAIVQGLAVGVVPGNKNASNVESKNRSNTKPKKATSKIKKT